jgi:hypothetical protein
MLGLVVAGALHVTAQNQPKTTDRPMVPYGFVKLDPISAGVYDSKGEPAARAITALDMMYRKGWESITKYFPGLGTPTEKEAPADPRDPENHRFIAQLVSEDTGRSPTPIIMMICSLKSTDVAGPLKGLHDELIDAIAVPDYSSWSLEQLRVATDALTQPRTNNRGVKYRAPKPKLSYKESVQLYAMTVSLLRKETKWKEWDDQMTRQGYANLGPPDLEDFTNRLANQLPTPIENGGSAALFLYHPDYPQQPLEKGEFEERADVVRIARKDSTFTVEQLPVYLTVDQKTWNPAWILPKDELNDTTLMARKYEYAWTRFDGPYLWYRRDQLNAKVTYQSTVRFSREGVAIEAERFVAARGEVVRVARDPHYDPRNMRPFDNARDARIELWAVEWPNVDGLALLRTRPSHIEEAVYHVGARKFLVYQTGPNAFTSSLYPPKVEALAIGSAPHSSSTVH